MTKTTGRGAKWVLDKPMQPIVKNTKKICTYVKSKLLSTGQENVHMHTTYTCMATTYIHVWPLLVCLVHLVITFTNLIFDYLHSQNFSHDVIPVPMAASDIMRFSV